MAIAMAAIGLASLVLLNLAALQDARDHMAESHWNRLARRTETTRDRIRVQLLDFERRLRYMAEDARFTAWARSAMRGTIRSRDEHEFETELGRACEVFDLQYLLVLSPEGDLLAGATVGHEPPHGSLAHLMDRATEPPHRWAADIGDGPDGRRVFEIALSLDGAGSGGRVPVLVGAADAEASLKSLLAAWSDAGPTAFGYLVRLEDQDVLYLTSPTPGQRAVPSAPVPLSRPESRPAAMAATGLEANVEESGKGRGSYYATTRFLPDLRWGLVGRIDRSVVMAGMRGALQRLLALDVALVLGVILLLWQFRRIYRRGLARAERRVTQRHVERVRAIFDSAFDAIVTYDRAGRVQAVNRAAVDLFGRTAEELEGQPLHRLLRWSSGDDETHQHGLPTPGVVRNANALLPDGQMVPTEMSLGVSGTGESLLYNAIIRDIRERLESERRIQAFAEGLESSNRRLEEVNAQLEETSRLKSEFLANTSHELRTPLNGIMGFLQLVLDGMCSTRDEEREFLQQALQCSRHLLGLINDVLDIARIEAGKLTVDVQKVSIDSLFDEVRTLTHIQAAQKGLRLEFEKPGGKDDAVRCDLGKAKQVLINLVGNSVKFTPQGSITVRALPRPSLGHVLFEVEDTGIGIPRERQAIIFEKFSQGDGSTTRQYGGTGLGLAISRSLVELMGGVIGVHSEGIGKGTKMYFSLPVWNEQGAPAAADDETSQDKISGPAGGPLVLTVEDDPVFRKFLAAVLHQHGYRTVEVTSAEAAWVRLRRLKPALVVLDYALACSEGAGLRTGWDLARRMTTDPETRHVPVLFVTGFEREVRDQLMHAAFARKPEHLTKPIEPLALAHKVETMVASVAGRQVRVLIAEDDPVVTAFIRKVLPEARFHLEIASNGEECLHILRSQPNGFDLLLLDLMMPKVSGYDVLREMALSGTASRVPVLVLTNVVGQHTAEEKRLLEEGLVVEVISKTSVHENPQLLAQLIDLHLKADDDDPGLVAAEAA